MRRYVESIDIWSADVPIARPVITAHGAFESQPTILLRVRSGDFVGWGAADPVAGFDETPLNEIVASVLSYASDLEGMPRPLDEPTSLGGAAGVGLDVAIADLRGHAAGLSVGELFGPRLRDSLDLTGWIGWESPRDAAAMAEKYVAAGFAALKIKLGEGIDADTSRVGAVRAAVGTQIHLRVDIGEAYDVVTAIEVLRAIRQYEVAAVEQPLDRRDLEGLATVRRESGIPVIADESAYTVGDVDELAKHDAVDGIKLKLLKHGGLRAAFEVAKRAEENGIFCVVGHGFATPVSCVAEAHLAATLPNYYGPGEMTGPLKLPDLDALLDPPLDLRRGKMIVPSGPGLGVNVNIDMVNRTYTKRGNE